jgi:2-polyprenyl-3-methyl-5-hydroxy-6-metoxy-1,4-benzoquinol methylase
MKDDGAADPLERGGPGATLMIGNVRQHFSAKAAGYDRYVAAFGYDRGLRGCFERIEWLVPNLRILDAGCGSGIPGLALADALERRGLEFESVHAFDLTPAMLDRYREKLRRRGIEHVELREANVLDLDRLPSSWSGYDLILSASMLEYVPREMLALALAGLRARLVERGRLLLFMTRRNWVTGVLVERPWGGNRYTHSELADAFAAAGFRDASFRRFPASSGWLNLWGHIVEARA